MDPITAARTDYEAAKVAYDYARAAMAEHTKARGTYRHDPAEWRAVDALHKLSSTKYQAWWRLSHAAA